MNLLKQLEESSKIYQKQLIEDASNFFKNIEGKLTCEWGDWQKQTRGARSMTYNNELRNAVLNLAQENGILTYPKKDSLFPFNPLYCSDQSPMREAQKLHFSEEQELKKYMKEVYPHEDYFIGRLGELIINKD